MTVQKVIEVIRGKELTPPIRPTNFELKYAFSGDLMSDALMVLREAARRIL